MSGHDVAFVGNNLLTLFFCYLLQTCSPRRRRRRRRPGRGSARPTRQSRSRTGRGSSAPAPAGRWVSGLWPAAAEVADDYGGGGGEAEAADCGGDG